MASFWDMLMGSNDTSQTATTARPPYVDATLQYILRQALEQSATPFARYPNEMRVAPFSDQQWRSFVEVDRLPGASRDMYQGAGQAIEAAEGNPWANEAMRGWRTLDPTNPRFQGATRRYLDAERLYNEGIGKAEEARPYFAQGAALARQALPFFGEGADAMRRGIGMFDAASGRITGDEISGAMNPYIGAVVKNRLRDMDEFFGGQQVAEAARQAKAGAFGGSRGAVADTLLRRDYARQRDTAANEGYASAYDTALQVVNQDRARRMQGAAGVLQGGQGLFGAGSGFLGAADRSLAAGQGQLGIANFSMQGGQGMAGLGQLFQQLGDAEAARRMQRLTAMGDLGLAMKQFHLQDAAQRMQLGTLNHNAQQAYINALRSSGIAQTARDQAVRDFDFSQFQQQQQYPWQQLGNLNAIFSGMPFPSTTTTTVEGAEKGIIPTVAGVGLTAAGIAGMSGGSDWLSWLT